MKIIAKRSVQLNGHIYDKGETAEYDGPIDDRIAALFTAADGSPLSDSQLVRRSLGEDGSPTSPTSPGDRIDKLVASLGRNGIVQKLEDLGCTYHPNMNTKTLAKLLLQQQGEIE